jgi:hypothetical protein
MCSASSSYRHVLTSALPHPHHRLHHLMRKTMPSLLLHRKLARPAQQRRQTKNDDLEKELHRKLALHLREQKRRDPRPKNGPEQSRLQILRRTRSRHPRKGKKSTMRCRSHLLRRGSLMLLRHKLPPRRKPPSTPMPPAVPSPAVSSVQKSQLMTPVGRKDHLHPKRDASADSQVDTPSGHSNTPSDHTRTSQPNGTTSSKPPSSNPQSTKAPTAQAWADEQKRLEKVGRDLKHAASDLLSNKPNSTSRRTGAAKSLESLFCYLLAFTCSDRAALAENKNIPMRSWRSLPPFGSFVAKATQDFAVLKGLHCSLSVVIHAHILDIAARYPSEGPSRDSMIELSGALHKAAVAADQDLDIDTLMANFPKTWAGRSKGVVTELGGEPRKLLQGGGYRLPLGVQTDALHATRAGLAMLKEWLAKEGVEYEFKLVG